MGIADLFLFLTVDADKAREKLPRGKNAEKFGESVGKEAGSNIDEAVSILFSLALCLFPISPLCFCVATAWPLGYTTSHCGHCLPLSHPIPSHPVSYLISTGEKQSH
jgi:hypothetical protein